MSEAEPTTSGDAGGASSDTPNEVEKAKALAAANYRHDWYQTETYVCINILIKGMKKEHVHVSYQERLVSVNIEVVENNQYNLKLTLAHSINADKCITKVLGSKIELKMMKCECLHWESLEPSENTPILKLPKDVPPKDANPSGTESGEKDGNIHKYPSSSHYTRDWDKLVAEVKQEEKDEKPEGDAALNKLFQQIYSDGSDETKKAMNKSFMQSGGTVLSTNWNEIAKDDVECKPPDGMEWKKYEK